MRRHLVFPTYELHPFNPGGVGVLLSGALRVLARAGHDITVLAEFADGEIDAARRQFAAEPLGDGSVEFVRLRDVDGGPPSGDSVYSRNSARFAAGLAAIDERRRIDYVEFPEYAGMGVVTLRKHRQGFLRHARVAVRLHGSLELIDRAEGLTPDAERRAMWALEREGLALAEALLTPSMSLARSYAEIYGLAMERFVLSPPPMEELLLGFERAPRLPDPAHFAFFGKLQEVKGCVQFAQAMTALLAMQPSRGWHATFIGRDTFCAAHQRMTSGCIERVIPPGLQEHFSFVPSIDRLTLGAHLRRAVAAVVPSKFEAFCLAAHELRATGIPLVVPRLPGFVDWLNEATGCLGYDGTANGLAQALQRIRDDEALRDALERAPAPRYPPFDRAYEALLS